MNVKWINDTMTVAITEEWLNKNTFNVWREIVINANSVKLTELK